ncbi:MAG TPA: DUF5678 domain-containing protein [Polyangiales bacterium]|nr:DUF5678 domain-containing protein [Polyangiales bacterium]
MSSNATKPVYLRGIPSDVVREAKAAAARRGVTLAGYVADALGRAVKQRDSAADPTSDLSREQRWYEKQRERLVREYDGEYVAIIGQSVIDHDEDFEALAERVFASQGARNIFMPLVGKARPAARVRSPRVQRR